MPRVIPSSKPQAVECSTDLKLSVPGTIRRLDGVAVPFGTVQAPTRTRF